MLSHPLSRLGCLILIGLAVLACNAPLPTPTPTPTPSPTPVATPTPTREPADTGWLPLRAGVALRRVSVATGEVAERILIVRLDPSSFRFRVLYTPGSGQRVLEWATKRGGGEPLLVVNGGYFTPEYHATGLVVSGGQTYGVSYGDFAGMFAVLPGGRVEVRWLATDPYDPDETLLEAVQSFPVLVKPGGVAGFPPDPQDLPARRTVVAQDAEGRILFLIATEGYLTLHELSRWLAGSDLGIDVALNLDGGQSTGLFLAAGDTRVEVDSLVPVPVVIVAEERE